MRKFLQTLIKVVLLMTADPFLSAPLVVQFHIVMAVLAVVIGPVAVFRRSRDRWHKAAGRLWVGLMLGVALSSLWINEGRVWGPFSPIHLLSALTLWGLWVGLGHIRAGRVAAHGRAMQALYAQSLLIAGAFTFLPGRRMNAMFFGAAPQLGFAIMLGLALAVVAGFWLRGRKNPLSFGRANR